MSVGRRRVSTRTSNSLQVCSAGGQLPVLRRLQISELVFPFSWFSLPPPTSLLEKEHMCFVSRLLGNVVSDKRKLGSLEMSHSELPGHKELGANGICGWLCQL